MLRTRMLAMMGVDEIEDLLLPIGERFAHSVHVNTLTLKGNLDFADAEKFFDHPNVMLQPDIHRIRFNRIK